MWRTQAVKRSWSCWRQSSSSSMYQPHSLLQPWRQRNCHLVVVENLSWNNRRQIGTSPGEVPCCLLIRSGDTWWMMKSRVAISEISEWRFFEEFCLYVSVCCCSCIYIMYESLSITGQIPKWQLVRLPGDYNGEIKVPSLSSHSRGDGRVAQLSLSPS